MDTNLNELGFGQVFVFDYGTVLNLCRALVTGRYLRTGQPLFGHWSCSSGPQCRVQDPELRDVIVEPPSDFSLLGFDPS